MTRRSLKSPGEDENKPSSQGLGANTSTSTELKFKASENFLFAWRAGKRS